MAHKKQYFRFRCPASFAIMMQGVTPTHIVPFGHFGFTAKYKRTPYQNDTDNFFSWIPHDKIPWYLSLLVKHTSVTRRTNHLFCISLRRLWWITPLPILSYGAFRPDRLQAFRLCYTARLQCHLVGMAESDRHKAHQCTQSLTGHYLPSCSWMRESNKLRGVHLVMGVYTSTYTLFPFESRRKDLSGFFSAFRLWVQACPLSSLRHFARMAGALMDITSAADTSPENASL